MPPTTRRRNGVELEKPSENPEKPESLSPGSCSCFPCLICKKSFCKNEALRRHQRLVHFTDKKFKCEFKACPAKFGTTSLLKRHQLSLHSTPEQQDLIKKQNKCELCPAKFMWKSDLRVHLQVHGEKQFECPYPSCPAKFAKKGGLTVHVRVHSEERPFQCPKPKCPAKFRLQGDLRTHLRLEHPATGQKLFHCPYCPSCPAKFTRKSNLTPHLLLHSGEKAFQCSECPARFTKKSGLTSHLVVHDAGAKQRRFQCPSCPRTFKRSPDLRRHTRVAHAHTLEPEPEVPDLSRSGTNFRSSSSSSSGLKKGRIPKLAQPIKKILESDSDSESNLPGNSINLVDPIATPTPTPTESYGVGGSFGIVILEEKFVPDFNPCQDQNEKEFEASEETETDDGQVAQAQLEARRFLCGLCDANFEDYDSLRHHDKVHEDGNSSSMHLPMSCHGDGERTVLPVPGHEQDVEVLSLEKGVLLVLVGVGL